MAKNSSSNVMWFVAGASVGVAAALVLTPCSGAEMRRRLSDKAMASKDVLATSGRDFLDKGRELYEKGRHLADEAADMFDEGRRLVEG